MTLVAMVLVAALAAAWVLAPLTGRGVRLSGAETGTPQRGRRAANDPRPDAPPDAHSEGRD